MKKKITLWLLARLLPRAHKPGRYPRASESEVSLMDHISYDSILEALSRKSQHAQVIFLQLYLSQASTEFLKQVSLVALFVTRKRELDARSRNNEESGSHPQGKKRVVKTEDEAGNVLIHDPNAQPGPTFKDKLPPEFRADEQPAGAISERPDLAVHQSPTPTYFRNAKGNENASRKSWPYRR